MRPSRSGGYVPPGNTSVGGVPFVTIQTDDFDNISVTATNIAAPFDCQLEQSNDGGATWSPIITDLVYPTNFPAGPASAQEIRLRVTSGPAVNTLSNIVEPP